MKIIKVLDFTEYPGLRHCSISDDSGEHYYHSVLNNEFKLAYERGENLIVDLDNTAGYPPSFIDEAFGNLIYDFGLEIVEKNMKIISNQEPDLIDLIEKETYLEWAERKRNKQKPKKTKDHKPWFALEKGKIVTRQ